MKRQKNGGLIKLGVLGIGRGQTFMGDAAKAAGFELVAICDQRAEAVDKVAEKRSVAAYTDYDKFLEHDMDAVMVANYFHQHAPFAVKALKAGKHVVSECAACHTLAEGVELIRAVEKTKRTYMFAENYAYTAPRQEMRRLFKKGDLGTFMYGEGEYIHPMSAIDSNRLSPGLKHWRNWNPATYYCTHSLSPIMYITDTMPEKVNGFLIRTPPDSPEGRLRPRKTDSASMIALRMDNGAVVKLLQVGLRGHSGPTRIHCAKGFMSDANGEVNIIREQFHETVKQPKSMHYKPEFPVNDALARSAGHGGGDFFVLHHFAEAIRTGIPPFLDVYRGVAMSVVGILAFRSALNDSNTLVIPDFRKESERRRYAKDDWSPDPDRRRPGQPWSSIEGDKPITAEALTFARNIWKANGYPDAT